MGIELIYSKFMSIFRQIIEKDQVLFGITNSIKRFDFIPAK